MSCDGNRNKYFAHVCSPGSAAAAAFGGQAEAQAALEQIFATARSQPVTDQQLPKLAEISTRALFAQMQVAQLKPPTHSASGLPRADAQRGYHVVYQTLEALKRGQTLPSLARQVLAARQEQRTIDARGLNAIGRLHCTSCGQFVKPQGGHICPPTATPEAMGRALRRRLRVPATAYPEGVLAKLIEQARQGPIQMTHGVSGEQVAVTLDGLPQALGGGFLPDWFRSESGFALAQAVGGRVVPVFDATGLQRVALAPTAIGQAAQAYGRQLAPGAVPGTAASVPSLPAHQVATAATTSVTGGQPYDVGHFIGTEYRKTDALGTPVTVQGKTYTVGQRVTSPNAWGSARHSGVEPVPGATKRNPHPTNPSVGVGRTTYAAVGLLLDGEIVETSDGTVEVYTKGRGQLLSVYDPATQTVGDTQGATNASAEQVAAVMAYLALHPQTASDVALANDLIRAQQGTGEPLAAADGAYIAFKNGPLAGNGTITFGGQVGTQKCPACGQFMGDAHVCPAAGASAAVAPAAGAAAPATPAPAPFDPATGGVNPATGFYDTPTDPYAPILADGAGTAAETGPVAAVAAPAAEASTAASVPDAVAPISPSADPQSPVEEPVAAPPREGAAPTVAIGAPEGTGAAPPVPPIAVTVEPKIEVTVPLDADAFAAALAANLRTIAPTAATQATTATDLSEVGAAMRELAAAMQAVAATGQGLPVGEAGGRRRRGRTQADDPTTERPAPDEERTGPRVRTAGKPIDITRPKTAQEHIVDLVVLDAPDPFLTNVPRAVGGDLDRPLTERVPDVDPNFAINEQTEKILRTMSAMLQLGGGKAQNTWSRAFGIYGPPGTGKNTTARQLAASIKTRDAQGNITQGMNYAEVNITPESSMDEMIGTTILTTDPQSGATVSKVALGKIGLAAAMGSVICVNEIVRNPKLATALQSMLEDGEIHVNSPETGDLIKVPVHPSTVFVLTWNPGNEGDPDRPAQAPLERIIPLHLGAPSAKEQEGRIDAFFAQFGTPDPGGSTTAADNERRRQEILANTYGIPSGQALIPSAAEKAAAVRLFNELGQLASGFGGGRKLGLNSDTPTAPGPRRLNRFMAIGKTQGWLSALETLKISCDQDDTFDEQWRLVQETFARHFGDDGEALSRSAPAQD
ncbi:MAG TPA: MoxR family ATPase [Herpetosiphonaceae bacterium]